MAGHGTSNYQPRNATARWINSRLPIFSLMNEQAFEFPTPKNLNYMWTFGAILTFMLATMMVTGIVLAMHYAANTEIAFDRVEFSVP